MPWQDKDPADELRESLLPLAKAISTLARAVQRLHDRLDRMEEEERDGTIRRR